MTKEDLDTYIKSISNWKLPYTLLASQGDPCAIKNLEKLEEMTILAIRKYGKEYKEQYVTSN